MPNANIKPSDRAPVLAVIDPDAYTAATYTSGWVDMSLWESLLAIVFAGTLGSGATLDAKLEQATSAAGAGAKDITGKAITQLTQAGTDSDKQAVINCQSEDLDVEGGFRYARLSMTVGTATSDAGGVVLGMDPRYAPTDATTVDEVVG
jgi:hypothetical protein